MFGSIDKIVAIFDAKPKFTVYRWGENADSICYSEINKKIATACEAVVYILKQSFHCFWF